MNTMPLPSTSKPFRDYRRLSNETEVLVQAISPLIVGAEVLVDVGAGTGSITSAFLNGRKIIAIEAARDNAAELRKCLAGSKHRIFRKSIEKLQLPEASIDAVVCCHALYYVRDVSAVIRKIFRWLKPRGLAVFVLLARTGDQSLVMSKYWKHYHQGLELPRPSSAELAKILRGLARDIKIKKTKSFCRVRTAWEQANFLSFTLDVPLDELLPDTRGDFKKFVERKRTGHRPDKLSTVHDVIFCRSGVIE